MFRGNNTNPRLRSQWTQSYHETLPPLKGFCHITELNVFMFNVYLKILFE